MTATPTCTCASLRKAARHATRFYDRALEPAGLGINQYMMLNRLHRFGPASLGELADALVADRSTVGHLVRPLQARGLLTLAADGGDRRRRHIAVTAEGAALLDRARPLWALAQARFDEAFGASETVALRDALARVAATALHGVSEGANP